jgi:tetratricopeptide (TPR) repeat protein
LLVGAAVLLALALGAVAYLTLQSGGPEVPSPDVAAMEPQVAAKIEEARQNVLKTPDSSDGWGRLGMVLHAHRLEIEAAVCYRRAVELSPAEMRWHYLLAHALRDSDAKAALAEAEAASRLDPAYAPAYVFRGQILEAGNEPEPALERYRRAAEIDPENAMAEFGLGRLLLAKGESDQALEHLLRARDLSPDAPEVRGALAQAYRRLGDQESALRENRLASELSETIAIRDPVHYAMRKEQVSSTALLERALDADRAEDYDTAEALFRDLVKLRPDDANIHARFGDALARQNKIGPAKEQYEAALAISPNMASAHYGLGNMLNFEGDYEAAARHYRAALEERPDHVSTLVNLAGILAFRGELAESEELCRRALELEPEDYFTNFQLGRLMLQRKRYREAIPFLRAAAEARPESGSAHLQLAIALGATGDLDSSRKHADRAEELGETVPEAMRKELERRAGTR